jgi:hypothetical protein
MWIKHLNFITKEIQLFNLNHFYKISLRKQRERYSDFNNGEEFMVYGIILIGNDNEWLWFETEDKRNKYFSELQYKINALTIT